jgi:type IV fimbrial biogenesis protein FimT
MHASKGFTLVELMVVVVILGIMSAIAVPGYQTIINNSRLTSTTNNLLGALKLARSEAASRNQTVTVCGSANATSCDGNWSAGGIILRAPSEVIKVLPAPEANVTTTGAAVVFDRSGRLGTAVSLSITNSYAGNRTITVNLLGQASAN